MRNVKDGEIVSLIRDVYKRQTLEVRVSNTAARSLYAHYDYMELNIRKGYYSDNGEDALVMCKALGGGNA